MLRANTLVLIGEADADAVLAMKGAVAVVKLKVPQARANDESADKSTIIPVDFAGDHLELGKSIKKGDAVFLKGRIVAMKVKPDGEGDKMYEIKRVGTDQNSMPIVIQGGGAQIAVAAGGGMNYICFAGTNVRDPELKTTNGGKKFCKLSVVFNPRMQGASDEEQKKAAVFMEMMAWGGFAEKYVSKITKGESILCQGGVKNREQNFTIGGKDGQPGKKPWSIEIDIDTLDSEMPQKRGGGPDKNASANKAYQTAGADDDLPF